MTGDQRGELLTALAKLSEARPEYRLGQMIANLVTLARGDAEAAIWNVEDVELLDAARKHLGDAAVRR